MSTLPIPSELPFAMSNPVGGGEPYLGQGLSLSQLVHATRRKLQDSTFGPRTAITLNQKELDVLERDMLELLHVVWSIKNTFAPINQVPPEIFSLILDHCEKDEELITLTHVCRGWREVLISHTSLWTSLDCKNLDKTALTLYGTLDNIHNLVKRFDSPAPLLEKLDIRAVHLDPIAVESTVFGGNLSSLHQTYRFNPGFLQHPRRTSGIPPHLKFLNVFAEPAHSVLLNHLHVPTGALVTLEFSFEGRRSPILNLLPKSLDNLQNITPVTSINLIFGSAVVVCIGGPIGGLCMFGTWDGPEVPPPMLDHRILQSLKKLPVLTTKKLAISQYYVSAHPGTGDSGAYQTLLPMNNLRALMLTDCHNVSFILALNPSKNTSNTMVCPKLEEFVLNIPRQRDESHIDELLEMMMERASRGAKLSSIVISCPWELLSAEEMSNLRSYAGCVEYMLDSTTPKWGILPGEPDGGYKSDR